MTKSEKILRAAITDVISNQYDSAGEGITIADYLKSKVREADRQSILHEIEQTVTVDQITGRVNVPPKLWDTICKEVILAVGVPGVDYDNR